MKDIEQDGNATPSYGEDSGFDSRNVYQNRETEDIDRTFVDWRRKPRSEETKKKISASKTGKPRFQTQEQLATQSMMVYANKFNTINKGTIWVNDGITNKRVAADNIPEGFVKGRL